MKKTLVAFLLIGIIPVLLGAQAPVWVTERLRSDEYFYGRGEGQTPAEAEEAGREEILLQLSTAGFIYVEGGSFQMGSTEGYAHEEPVHTVRVGDFYIGKYEVTQAEWEEVMGSNPSYFKGTNRPVEQVSWYDAVEYCNKRSQREGLTPVYRINGESVTADWNADGYRLPTEAEWEYAARGGNESKGYKYAGSDNVDQVGWYWRNSGDTRLDRDWDIDKIIANNGRTQPVGGKSPNELGLYDMSGNVWEWCWDWKGSYSSGSQTNPKGPGSGRYRVDRGGSWISSAGFLRSAVRHYNSPGDRGNGLGFRLVRQP